MISVKEWEAIKKKIDKETEKVNIQKGRLESAMTQLKKNFDCDTIEDAKKKLEEMKVKRDKVEKKLNVLLEELEEFEWDE